MSYNCHTMSVLTVRISEKEKALLAKRARAAGMTSGAYVRELIREKKWETAADVLAEMDAWMGNKGLRVKPRK